MIGKWKEQRTSLVAFRAQVASQVTFHSTHGGRCRKTNHVGHGLYFGQEFYGTEAIDLFNVKTRPVHNLTNHPARLFIALAWVLPAWDAPYVLPSLLMYSTLPYLDTYFKHQDHDPMSSD